MNIFIRPREVICVSQDSISFCFQVLPAIFAEIPAFVQTYVSQYIMIGTAYIRDLDLRMEVHPSHLTVSPHKFIHVAILIL